MVVDIYGAVLMAIGSRTGPLTSISYETLRAAMRDIAGEEAPRGQEIARILDEIVEDPCNFLPPRGFLPRHISHGGTELHI